MAHATSGYNGPRPRLAHGSTSWFIGERFECAPTAVGSGSLSDCAAEWHPSRCDTGSQAVAEGVQVLGLRVPFVSPAPLHPAPVATSKGTAASPPSFSRERSKEIKLMLSRSLAKILSIGKRKERADRDTYTATLSIARQLPGSLAEQSSGPTLVNTHSVSPARSRSPAHSGRPAFTSGLFIQIPPPTHPPPGNNKVHTSSNRRSSGTLPVWEEEQETPADLPATPQHTSNVRPLSPTLRFSSRGRVSPLRASAGGSSDHDRLDQQAQALLESPAMHRSCRSAGGCLQSSTSSLHTSRLSRASTPTRTSHSPARPSSACHNLVAAGCCDEQLTGAHHSQKLYSRNALSPTRSSKAETPLLNAPPCTSASRAARRSISLPAGGSERCRSPARRAMSQVHHHSNSGTLGCTHGGSSRNSFFDALGNIIEAASQSRSTMQTAREQHAALLQAQREAFQRSLATMQQQKRKQQLQQQRQQDTVKLEDACDDGTTCMVTSSDAVNMQQHHAADSTCAAPPAAPQPEVPCSALPMDLPPGSFWEAVQGVVLVMPVGCQITRAGGGALFITSPTVYVQLQLHSGASAGHMPLGQQQQQPDAAVLASNCGTRITRSKGNTVVTIFEPLMT